VFSLQAVEGRGGRFGSNSSHQTKHLLPAEMDFEVAQGRAVFTQSVMLYANFTYKWRRGKMDVAKQPAGYVFNNKSVLSK